MELNWCLSLLHISHKAIKFIVDLTRQVCGDIHAVSCLFAQWRWSLFKIIQALADSDMVQKEATAKAA